tara:strand:- start:341 stop:649 length:309 start_codon:yes stop_codon:yes gene_type:complete
MRNDRTKRRYGSIPEIFGLRDWYVRNFDNAFETHDYHYESVTLSRNKADKILLRDMKALIQYAHTSKRKRVGYYITAYAAYLMVRLFGWSSYGKSSGKITTI